ncbi:FAD-linked oxidase-like protein [Staphylotrichum tortipilum]|uniref:FAD-linked oxidase-like protein n=1 Tax=Staphylotrichum tortipilum TaxID=2831512 RepID=A0AAN6MGG4_9PEZI|nr:FAD-linked oxidase-like protein [Staphylotrichum longicolle]
MAETPNPQNGSVEPQGSASGDVSVKTADAPNTAYLGQRDESIRAHDRFLWLTLLASAAVIEYGLDHALGAFQAMVGFLKIFGYEDPRVPAGWNIAAGPQQIIASFMVLGAFIACFTTGPMSSYFSRRWSILIGVVLIVILICGIEAVLADGTLVRTGMGAVNESLWPLFRGGYGPTYDSMFSQSNFGIVTKMTLWSSPAPLGFMSCHIAVPKETDLVPMVDIFRELLKHDVIQNHPVIGNILRELGKRGTKSKCWWDANFGLYGPHEIIEVNYKRCQEAFKAIPGARLRGNTYYPDASKGEQYLDAVTVPYDDSWMQTGVPSMAPIVSIQYRGVDGGHISFSPIVPADGQSALDWYYEAKKTCAVFGFDFVAGLHLYQRHLAHLIMIYFDRTDQEDKTAANALFIELVKRARANGYGEYRAHIDHMDLVAGVYDFGKDQEGSNGVPALMRLNQRIKDELDPNGILLPGKQGIWPQKYRGEGAKKR